MENSHEISIRKNGVAFPYPGIVQKDLFEAAQRKLDEGRKISSRGVIYEYLVGRRITCECGYTMRSTTTPRTFHRQKGTTTIYYSNYRCPGRHSMRVNSACTMKPVKVSAVDERTWEWVKEEVANPIILERKLREIQSEQRDKNGGKYVILDYALRVTRLSPASCANSAIVAIVTSDEQTVSLPSWRYVRT